MSKFAKLEIRKASRVAADDIFAQLFDAASGLQNFGAAQNIGTGAADYLSGASHLALGAAGSNTDSHDQDVMAKPDALTGSGTISLGAIDTAVTENFDTLANSGTSSTLPNGWYFDETGTAANLTYTAGTGSGTTGDVYSLGATGDSDRAFGSLQSGSLVPVLGAQFTNNTGASIGSLDVAYVGEQWRLGATGRADSLVFQISFDATSVSSGTWTTVSQLNFTSPVQSGATGALNGNSAANQTAISYSLVLANAIASGQSFWIRWTDTNATSSDDALAIDNFSITPRAATPSAGNLAIDDVTLAEGNLGTTNYTFTVTRSGGSAGAVSATWALANSTTDNADFTAFPQGGTVNFADGQTSATITVTVAGDTVFEGNDQFFVNLTNPTGGATISDSQGQGTITNDDTAPVAQLSINDITLQEGNSGTTNFTFTVTRGGDTSIAASATWTVANGTTDAADFTGALTGTVAFAVGDTSQT
ncbi:MAG TPA: Calx-beta domain-containing protein, partial [Sphingorhabdus sp.]|nr:Calx-beta domain-containing protein [Sphingorhabdus sp.]